MLILFLLVFIILGIYFLNRRDKRMVLLYKQFPCVIPELPFLGQTYKFLGNNEQILQSIQTMGKEAENKGGIMGMWHLNVLHLMISDAEISEVILKNCLEKGDVISLCWVIMGKASVFAPVSIWRPRRKLHTPSFTTKKLRSFVKVFNKQSSVMIEKLKPVAGKGPISMWPYFTSYALDAVCEATMGIEVNAQKDTNNPFIVGLAELLRLVAARFNKPWLHSDFVFKILHAECKVYKAYLYNFIEKIIKENRAHGQDLHGSNKKKKYIKSFLDMMIESSNTEHGYTDLALQEEILVLLGAATDTTAVGTSFTTVLLSRHPRVQEKVYREIQEVFGDSDRPVVEEDLPKLKYLEAVIKESLRLYPPVPVILRKIDRDITLPSGKTLLESCGVFINIWSVQRNPLYWGPEADEFRPERFIDEPPKHPAAFLAFSHGPRNCLGSQYAIMSMKTIISNILRRYRLLPALDQDGEFSPLKLKFEVMMKDANGYLVCLEDVNSSRYCY